MTAAPLGRVREGAGEPLLLVNGGMMSFPAWEPIAAPLRERYEVLRYDLRGQLFSPGTPHPDLAGHVDDALALLDEEGWPSAHVVAASYGAMVAIELAARAPERVRSLVLMVVMDRATPEFRSESDVMRQILAEVIAGGERGRFYDVLVEGVYSPEYRRTEAATLAARRAQIDQLPVEWFRGVDGLLAAVESFDVSAAAASIRCPTLVIDAAGDRVMSAVRSHALAQATGARHALHPTSGHAIVAEDPAWVAATCLEFLDGLREPARGGTE